ncbi:MAG: hypothetical protein H0V40_09125 [Actinobacteria bacterium]|nr:hypothetical protein [Actinomycetota bacterium]
MLPRRLSLLAAVVLVLAGLCVPAATASPALQVGIVEHAEALTGNPDRFFPQLRTLRAQLLRVNLNWGGRIGVARLRPGNGADPADPAYDWGIYDRAVLQADRQGVRVIFSIFGTPVWANGVGLPQVAPLKPAHLERFAYAAALRYSGTFRRPDGRVLPAVRHWIAWNEPNLRLGLVPQYRRVGPNRWAVQSAVDYARICNAIVDGVHATGLRGERVACGVTAPRGNNNPRGARPSVSPLAFLRAMKRAGARGFDAYAHQAYYGGPSETPSTRPGGRTAITLANIDALVAELDRLYGRKRLWITEYGYQTSPPDPFFGVSWSLQARYLTQAFAIARRNPRIDMMLWFLLRDEARLDGWQSGLVTRSGRRKPAFAAFQRLRR